MRWVSSPGPRHSCQELLGFSSCCSAHRQIVSGKDFGQAAFLEEASASGYLIRPGSGEDCHKQTELGPKLGAGILCSQLTSTSKERPAQQVGAPVCVGLGHWWQEEPRGRCLPEQLLFPKQQRPSYHRQTAGPPAALSLGRLFPGALGAESFGQVRPVVGIVLLSNVAPLSPHRAGPELRGELNAEFVVATHGRFTMLPQGAAGALAA